MGENIEWATIINWSDIIIKVLDKHKSPPALLPHSLPFWDTNMEIKHRFWRSPQCNIRKERKKIPCIPPHLNHAVAT